jgi:predicted RNA-binding protein with PUA-like domain
MRYWLLKSEPGNYSIRDFERDGQTSWTGVRNYQARNFMQKDMRPGDLGIFYHSNSDPSGCFGLLRVAEAAQPDETQFDSKSKYFEPRASEAKPVWFCVDVEYVATFKKPVSIAMLRSVASLKNLEILKKGSRLSITPVSEKDFKEILKLAGYKKNQRQDSADRTQDRMA